MSSATSVARRASKQRDDEIARQASLPLQNWQHSAVSHSNNEVIFDLNGQRYQVICLRSTSVSVNERKQIMDLLEENMRDKYEASLQGWSRREKQGELFDKNARFGVLKSDGVIVAFVNWRFDVEECDEEDLQARTDEEVIEVLYCYEVQVSSTHRSQKLGSLLMEMLSSIAFESKMRKVMLTVFLANNSARSFYQKIGYSVDLISPSLDGEERVDYVILSKEINRQS